MSQKAVMRVTKAGVLWLLATGYWLQATSHWLLAIGNAVEDTENWDLRAEN